MSKGQGDGQRAPQPAPPPAKGTDPLALVTLIGVVALLMLAFANWRDVSRLDRTLGDRLSRLEARLDRVADNANRPAEAAARRGPDPNRVYTIKTDGAPIRGNVGAPVTIVEFSDFQ
jgi:protein-disulfide isomerase